MATKARRKRCSECGELKDDVMGRQRLCEDCEEGKDYCTICDEHIDRSWGNGCRHVGWSREHGCTAGCGSDSLKPHDHHASFMALLKVLEPLKSSDGQPLLLALRKQIARHAFFTQWFGPLIGASPDLDLRYELCEGHFSSLLMISSQVQEAWGTAAIESMQLGMAWLTSLDDRSKSANKTTAEWIDTYLRRHVKEASRAE